MAAAPLLVDYVSDEALAAFERVQAGLTALGVSFELAPRLVRGLDYYTRTTFEFAATSLDAAQNAVGGGGRYDGLVADLGGPPEPGVGFALGVDRTLLACDSEDTFPAAGTDAEVFVVATTGGLDALELADELRRAGIRAERGYDHRSMKAQMKGANRSGAAVAVIVGESEAADSTVTIRPLRAENQEADRPQFAVARTDMLAHVKELLSKWRAPTSAENSAPTRSARPSPSPGGSTAAANTGNTSPSSTSATTAGSPSAWSTTTPTFARST